MKIVIKGIFYSFILAALTAGNSYAGSTGGPHLWLSTDANNFDEGGAGYVNSGPGWQDDSYVSKNMPFTMYLYNAAPHNKGTAHDIGLIVAVHKGDKNGSITIADAFGVETTLTYADFSANNPYPGGSHGIDGVYAILKPSQHVNLTTDYSHNEDTSSDSSSWTNFVIKSSSFSEVHFDAKSFGDSSAFYNPGSHDVDLYGVTQGSLGPPVVPEPASLALVGMGLFGFLKLRRRK